MKIWTIRKGFEALESKLDEAFECKFEPFEWDMKFLNAISKNSKGIRSIRIQIRTIWKGFEALECKF